MGIFSLLHSLHAGLGLGSGQGIAVGVLASTWIPMIGITWCNSCQTNINSYCTLRYTGKKVFSYFSIPPPLSLSLSLSSNQLCINTAIVYMHRFYTVHSFRTFHRAVSWCVCLGRALYSQCSEMMVVGEGCTPLSMLVTNFDCYGTVATVHIHEPCV